jgi:hypothetical protein
MLKESTIPTKFGTRGYRLRDLPTNKKSADGIIPSALFLRRESTGERLIVAGDFPALNPGHVIPKGTPHIGH